MAAKHTGPYPLNRLREYRKRRGLSQTELGRRAGFSQQKVGSIERGRSAFKLHDAEKFARELDCDPADLLPTSRGPSLPLTIVIAAHESEDRPDTFDLQGPHERVQAPRHLRDTRDCFAADVHDDSADRLDYPAGSTLVLRGLPDGGAGLDLGSQVVVRHFVTKRADGATFQVLVGVLNYTRTGALVLELGSSKANFGPSIVIQPPPPGRLGLGAGYRDPFDGETPDTVDYSPNPDDPAEIIGEVVSATVPRNAPKPVR